MTTHTVYVVCVYMCVVLASGLLNHNHAAKIHCASPCSTDMYYEASKDRALSGSSSPFPSFKIPIVTH